MAIPTRLPSSDLRDAVHGTAEDRELDGLRDSADLVIEARGTFCPEPVIRIQNRLRTARLGTVAVLLADDAGVEIDIPAWCLSTGNEFLGMLREPDHLCVLVRRRSTQANRAGR